MAAYCKERHCSRCAGETLHHRKCRLRQLKPHRGVKLEAVGDVASASTPQLHRAAMHKLHSTVLPSEVQLVTLSDDNKQRAHKEERL